MRLTARSGLQVAALGAKLGVSACIVWVLLTRVDFKAVQGSVAGASVAGLVLAFAAFLLIPLLGGVRWWITLRGLREHPNLLDLTAIFSTAMLVAQVLPSVAGDGTRVVLAARKGVGAIAAVQSVLLERVSMIVTLLLLSLATAPALSSATGHAAPVWLSLALCGAAITGLFVLLMADQAPRWIRDFRIWRLADDLAVSARQLVFSRWGLGLAVISLAANLTFSIAAFLLASAMGVDVSVWQMVAVMPAVTLATVVPISFGGWGVREGMLTLLLGYMGVPASAALSLSLLFGVFGILCGLPGLAAWATISRRTSATPPLQAGTERIRTS